MTFALALGVGTRNQKGLWLEVYYPKPMLSPEPSLLAAVQKILNYQGGNQAIPVSQTQMRELSDQLTGDQAALAAQLARSERPLVITVLETDDKPTSTPEVYLKLQLLSHRLVKPHQVALDGMFALLINTAWTSDGAIDAEELAQRQLEARIAGRNLEVFAVDKFPKMANYVVPNGVRIGDAARVRLGAYLGEGTTVMHEGFVNFNAGTEGTSMVEGRISAGVMVGEGSDLGGGCSTMGTLSGGGNIRISVGKKSLIGANAGIGIPLGDSCKVEAGLYVTAGTKVVLLDEQDQPIKTVKARELAGMNELLFRRSSLNGQVECKINKTAIELNEALHANQ